MKRRTFDFSRYSAIRIGPVVEVKVLERGERPPAGHVLVGGANNLLVGPNPPPLAMLGKDFDYCRPEDGVLVVGAATPTGRLLSFCKKYDIGGFEYVTKLPGTVGGMVAMNAGVKRHETFDRLLHVVTDRGTFARDEIPHGYRYAELPGIVYEAVFEAKRGYDAPLARELLALRSSQPKEPSVGSAFKNPPGDFAGRLIEAVGLKGRQLGGMAWSEMHANFLVNKSGDTFEGATALMALARSRVHERFGIRLEPEIKIIHNPHRIH